MMRKCFSSPAGGLLRRFGPSNYSIKTTGAICSFFASSSFCCVNAAASAPSAGIMYEQRMQSSSAAGTSADRCALTQLCHETYPSASMRASKLQYGPVALVGNKTNPSAICLLSHGLGDTCHGFADLVSMELQHACPHVLFVLPTAAEQSVTLNGGFKMPAWYDIAGLGERSEEDPEGVAISVAYMHSLVNRVAREHNLSWSKVVCSGFSQGGAVACALGLLAPEAPAGIAVLSGYLAAREYVLPRIKNKDVKIFHGHGTSDPMVRLRVAQRSKEVLEQHGVNSVDFRQYPMEHSTHPLELQDFAAFINNVCPK